MIYFDLARSADINRRRRGLELVNTFQRRRLKIYHLFGQWCNIIWRRWCDSGA